MISRTVRFALAAGLIFAGFSALPAAAADRAVEPALVPEEGLKSLSGSFVVFDSGAGGDACWQPSTPGTFCFRAESYTDDWEWVFNVWLQLPSDWIVSEVVVAGSPTCDNGGSFDPFSWSFQTPSYEVDIDHGRNMSSADHCVATYCVDVTAGSGGGDALVSWYWDGDSYGGAPHWPCSDDGYTPSGQPACDESVAPRAAIPDCSAFGRLEGTIRDAYTAGPTCTDAAALVEPAGVAAATDAGGFYGPVWLAAGDYDITATADGFDEITVNTIPIIVGVTTTQDFDLLRPVLDAGPTSVDTTVDTGATGDETLTIGNTGYLPPLDWTLRELPSVEVANPLTGPPAAKPVEVEPELAAEMDRSGEAGYIIDFRERPDLSPALSMGWQERGEFVVDALRDTAARTQARVRAYLDDRRVAYRPFWIDNLIVVDASSSEVLDGLLGFDEIEVLRARRVLGLIEPEDKQEAPAGGRAIEPNISHVNADQAWGLGFDGTGMVVANIDTGVRYTHEVLEPHYRGNLGGGSFDHDYNWLSGTDGSTTPVDDHGHGSHTMGTMVGDDGGANQTGIAPGATWIACDACQSTGCPDAALLTCAQWIAAPYPSGDPSSPDPSKRPHVVNNSWGDCGQSYDSWYQGSVDSWHAAGIYPVFSNGNASNCFYPSPPGCNTVGNPGRYGNVTGVGSTGQSNGAYASHSNWGPTDNVDTVNPDGFPTVKPQVVAPGVDIRSSLNGSDSSYGSWAGTSMSAPHVSGLVALMWQAAPCLIGDYAQTETILQSTAVAIPYASNCGGEGPGNLPNMATGWGEIDALAAVVEATTFCNTDWLPWVSEDLDAGQVASGATQDVTLTFSCGPDPGDESGTLRLTSSDPCAPTTDIPLALHCVEGTTVTDLAVSTTDGLATAVPGSATGYTVVVSNGGPDDAVGATVSDVFPAALTGVAWSCVGSGGATCTAAGAGSINDTVDVPNGGTVTYTVSAVIDPAATGTLTNTATVTEPAEASDPVPGDNSATDTTTLSPEVDLAITKTDGLTTVMVGEPVSYTITVGNAGPSAAPGAAVNDGFPAELTGVSWSCVASGGAACSASGSGDIADTVDLPVGGSLVYTTSGSVAASAAGQISNTATVTPPAGVTEIDPSDNSTTDITDVVSLADLHGSLTDDRCWVPPGDPTTYTLEVFNDGPADAIGSLVDTYAETNNLTGITWTCTPTGGASCPPSGTGPIFTAVDLPAGSSMVFVMTGTVDPGATGWLLTRGYVAPPLDVIDPTPEDARWSDIDALEPPILCDGFETGDTGAWTSTAP